MTADVQAVVPAQPGRNRVMIRLGGELCEVSAMYDFEGRPASEPDGPWLVVARRDSGESVVAVSATRDELVVVSLH